MGIIILKGTPVKPDLYIHEADLSAARPWWLLGMVIVFCLNQSPLIFVPNAQSENFQSIQSEKTTSECKLKRVTVLL